MNGNSQCLGYRIETLQWLPEGRHFATVGHVTSRGNIVISHEMFPNVKFGFNKRQLLVTMVEVFLTLLLVFHNDYTIET